MVYSILNIFRRRKKLTFIFFKECQLSESRAIMKNYSWCSLIRGGPGHPDLAIKGGGGGGFLNSFGPSDLSLV